MDNFGTFLYQSGISIAVFYLFYWALLRRETWFTLNRILLGSSLLLAVAIPFVKITLHAAPEPGTVYYAVDHYLMDGAIVRPSTLAERAGIHLTVGNVFLLIYGAGVLFFLIKFLVQIFQVLHLIHRYGIRDFEGYRIVPIDREISPFSFFTLIFINTEKMEGEELHSILLHEWEHVRRLHTLDILLLEIVCIIQWFNPFVWLYKYSLHELHEYEADQAVISRGENRLSYQQLILSQAFGHNFFPVVHDLVNRSFIKKRIVMITKQKSRNITLLKSLLILPVAAILVVSFSFTREPASLQQMKNLFTGNENVPVTVNESPQEKPPVIQGTPTLPDPPQTKIYDIREADTPPLFQGKSMQDFLIWVKSRLSDSTVFNNAPLRVSFIIDSKGKVTDVHAENARKKKVDDAHLRKLEKIIASSPRWTPATKDGKKVAVRAELLLQFWGLSSSPKEQIFFIVEQMPKFQGHDFNYFRKWVGEQLHYPKVAAEHGIEGRVFVRFIVFPNGHVDSVKVVRGVDPALDAEALRVVRSSPDWTPGKQRGKKVAVAFVVPVIFELKKSPPPPVASPGGEVFSIVEQMPKFQGGTIDDFREWVAKQLVYPEDAAEKGISGRVLVSFIVEPDGSLSNIKVVKGSYPSLDAEALRVVKSSPKWEPGVQRNRKVRVSMTIPIVFILDHTIPAMEDIHKSDGQQIVYVVDGKKIKKEEIKNLDAAHVARVWVSTEKKVTEKYGPEARDGVIFISTYKEVPEGKTLPKPKPPKK